MGIMWFFKKKVKEHKGLKPKKEHIKQSYQSKLDALKRKKFNMDQVIDLFQEFMGEYYHLNYEFSLEELKKDLDKKRIRKKLKNEIDEFIDQLSELKYNPKLNILEMHEIIDETSRIINEL